MNGELGLTPDETVFYEACINGVIGDVKTLLVNKKIQNINMMHADGCTFLHLAALFGHKDIVTYLLDNGALHQKSIKFWYLPIHCASLNGHSETVDVLLKRGSLPLMNNKDINGNTALHLANKNSKCDVVKLLINRDASIDIKNNSGQTPLMIARDRSDVKSVQILEDKEEDRKIQVERIGCELLRVSRGICAFEDIPNEILSLVLEYFDYEGRLSKQQIRKVVDYGFDMNSLSNDFDKQQFLSQNNLPTPKHMLAPSDNSTSTSLHPSSECPLEMP